MKEKISCIYCLELNNKKYIGQTKDFEQRKRSHKIVGRQKNRKYKSAIHSAIEKYGYENISFSILEECPINLLDEREVFWIKEINTLSPNGYNLDTGGKQNREMSEETKEKLRKRNRERIWSKESKEKLAKYRKGIKQSEETKKKRMETYLNKSEQERRVCIEAMRQTNLNREYPKTSVEQKKKLSEIHSRIEKKGFEANTSKQILCIELNIVFETIKDCAKWCMNNNICVSMESFMIKSARAKFDNFEAYGYNWKKINKEQFLKIKGETKLE